MEDKNFENSLIKNSDNKTFLEVFGFVSNQARMNLVIFFICLLIVSNVFFVWRVTVLNTKLIECERSKNEVIINLHEKITEEVRKQIQPTKSAIKETIIKIDSINSIDVNAIKNTNNYEKK